MNSLEILNDYFTLQHFNRKQRRDEVRQFRGLSSRQRVERMLRLEEECRHLRVAELSQQKALEAQADGAAPPAPASSTPDQASA